MLKYEINDNKLIDYINSKEEQINLIITENYFSKGIKRGIGIDDPYIIPFEFISENDSSLAKKRKKDLFEYY